MTEPILASADKAARLLDMTRGQFLELVAEGHLPRPRRIGQLERFDVEELRKVARGDMIGGGGMEW